MEININRYLHIQIIKKLYNEINNIKKQKRKYKKQNLAEYTQTKILNREDLILKIIGIYDLLEYYYCIGNVVKLKNIMKLKEKDIESYFQIEELDKYHMMIAYSI